MLRVLGSYWMEDLENILIGLGLQALRVHMADNTTHLFLTRTSKEAEDILWLLTASNFPQLTSSISLQSWEKVQLKLLENCIHPSLEMGIFLYSLLMFWKNDTEGKHYLVDETAHYSVAGLRTDRSLRYLMFDGSKLCLGVSEIFLEAL